MEFKEVTQKLEKLYQEKNKKYGNSFKELVDDLGPNSGVVQIIHKANRLKSLIKHGENIEDTLMDLANYSIMLLMELKR